MSMKIISERKEGFNFVFDSRKILGKVKRYSTNISPSAWWHGKFYFI